MRGFSKTKARLPKEPSLIYTTTLRTMHYVSLLLPPALLYNSALGQFPQIAKRRFNLFRRYLAVLADMG